jgi:hypothetical protein
LTRAQADLIDNNALAPSERQWKSGVAVSFLICCVLFLAAQRSWAAGGQNSGSAPGDAATAPSANSPATPTAPVKLPAKRGMFHIFLLMGQSNMAGHGCVDTNDPCPAGWDSAVPHVLVLDGQGLIDTATPQKPIAWRAGSQPLHLNQPLSARYGLGMDFAKAYGAAHPGVTVGLIPCAWGGAPIGRLNKGTPDYENCMTRAKFAEKSGTIMGVLWHQGEADSGTPELAGSYAGKLDTLVSDIRADLKIPNLIFVVGDLAEFYGTNPKHHLHIDGIIAVRDALSGLPYRVRCTGFVSTTGLKSADEEFVHFDQPSYVILGDRYAEVVLDIQKLYGKACQ